MRRFLLIPALYVLAAGCRGVEEEQGGPGVPGGAEPVILPTGEWTASVQIPAGQQRLSPEQEALVKEAVAQLGSQDFAKYSAAASRLVALGEPVVPYLGYVGDAESDGDRTFRLITVILAPILHALEADRFAGPAQSPYRPVRASAATVIGERHMLEYAPELVTMLMDHHKQVRRSAIRALRVLCNRYFGYRPSDSKGDRSDAVRKWREFLGTG